MGMFGFGGRVCACSALVLSLSGFGCSDDSDGSGGNSGGSGGGAAASGSGSGGDGAAAASGGSGGDAASGGTAAGGSGGSGAAGAGGSGGSGAAGAGGSGGSGAAAMGGSGGAAAGVTSNPAGLDYTLVPSATAQGLVLLSSSLTQQITSLNYVQWYGVVENAGTTTVCHVEATVAFESASDISLLTLSAFANAEAYDGSLTLSIPCIAPGKRGSFWTNDLLDAPVDLAAIVHVEVQLSGQNYPEAVPHPMTPALVSAAITPHSMLGSGYWAVSGRMQATDTIYNYAVDADLIGAEGWIVDRITAFHLETWAQGTTWDFETTDAYEGAMPSDFVLFADFIEGAEPLSAPAERLSAPAAGPSAPAERLSLPAERAGYSGRYAWSQAAFERELAARRFRREARERRELARDGARR